MVKVRVLSFVVFWVLLILPRYAKTCDVCDIYSAKQAGGEFSTGFIAGVLEQYTHFGSVKLGDQKVFDPIGQYLDSSITQFYLGYNFTDAIGLQLNVPYIYREWVRPQNNFIEKGSNYGIGDLSLIGTWQPYRYLSQDVLLSWNLEGGVKFPSGDTDELDRFQSGGGCSAPAPLSPNPANVLANHAGGAGASVACSNGVINVIPGSETTLGSGSYDGILGTSVYASFKRVYARGSFHYAIRTANHAGFEYRDDLTWRMTPGVYLWLTDSFSLAVEALSRGWWADEVYLGPGVSATFQHWLSFTVSADFPVYYHARELQIAPDYRVSSALTFHLPLGS